MPGDGRIGYFADRHLYLIDGEAAAVCLKAHGTRGEQYVLFGELSLSVQQVCQRRAGGIGGDGVEFRAFYRGARLLRDVPFVGNGALGYFGTVGKRGVVAQAELHIRVVLCRLHAKHNGCPAL